MSTPSTKPEAEFTRLSTTESICMWCYRTVRVKNPEDLADDERVHASICLHRPGDSPFRKRRL